MSRWCANFAVALALVCAGSAGVTAKGRGAKAGDDDGGGGMPTLKISAGAAMPACVTPGRLQAFVKSRNDALDARYAAIAADYMRHGQALDIRWDYAFFQMMLETGNLSFKSNGRQGDVRIKQNNFAGIGASGGGEKGESFPDVSTGVKAHIEHLRLYAADPVDDPVAYRTRKVREWGVLDSWQKQMKRPVTFKDLARRWAANGSYANDIKSVADKFFEDQCTKPDPQPELTAAATAPAPGSAAPAKTAAAVEVDDDDKPSGKTLAKRSGERGRSEQARRSALGGANLAKPAMAVPGDAAPAPQSTAEPAPTPPAGSALSSGAGSAPVPSARIAKDAVLKPKVTLINPPATGAAPASSEPVSAATAPKPLPPGKAPVVGTVTAKCRVWTASYGGQKAIIIKSVTDQTTNYTVLDVNEGAEKREADAYIKAYAKDGELVAEYANQTTALDKAFELCPEG